MNQPQILIIEAEEESALEIRRALEPGAFEVVWANEIQEVFAFLTETENPLIITSLHLGGLDAFSLMRWLVVHRPEARLVILADDPLAQVSNIRGAVSFVHRQGGLSRLHAIAVDAFAGHSPEVAEADLFDVLTLLLLTRSTRVLHVFLEDAEGNREGRVFILEGKVLHAQAGEKEGISALKEMLEWAGGGFYELDWEPPPRTSLQEGEVEALLLAPPEETSGELLSLLEDAAAEMALLDGEENPPSDMLLSASLVGQPSLPREFAPLSEDFSEPSAPPEPPPPWLASAQPWPLIRPKDTKDAKDTKDTKTTALPLAGAFEGEQGSLVHEALLSGEELPNLFQPKPDLPFPRPPRRETSSFEDGGISPDVEEVSLESEDAQEVAGLVNPPVEESSEADNIWAELAAEQEAEEAALRNSLASPGGAPALQNEHLSAKNSGGPWPSESMATPRADLPSVRVLSEEEKENGHIPNSPAKDAENHSFPVPSLPFAETRPPGAERLNVAVHTGGLDDEPVITGDTPLMLGAVPPLTGVKPMFFGTLMPEDANTEQENSSPSEEKDFSTPSFLEAQKAAGPSTPSFLEAVTPPRAVAGSPMALAARSVAEARAAAEAQTPKVADLVPILEEMSKEVPEFLAAGVVESGSGVALGGLCTREEFDIEGAFAYYAEVLRLLAPALSAFEAPLDDLLVTSRSWYILVRYLNQRFLLGLITTRRGNLGICRRVLRRAATKILERLPSPSPTESPSAPEES